jgi:hypothetical protein
MKEGLSVPVAHVYGSAQYQAFMRRTTATESGEKSSLCQFIAPYLNYLTPLFGSALSYCRNEDALSVLSVMQTLKAAVEAYLGTNICFSALSLDVYEESRRIVAQDALGTLGLRQVLPTIQAAKGMVLAYRPGAVPKFEEDPWVILAIDHSSHWYNVGLFTIGEAGVVDPIPGFVNSPTIGENNQLEGLERSISHILANPPSEMRPQARIHRVLLYGDDAKNETMRAELEKLLDPKLIRDAWVSNSVFDGANFTAYTAYTRMDTADFESSVHAAWGCKWRSTLYRETRDEL